MRLTLVAFQEKAVKDLRLRYINAVNSYSSTRVPQLIAFTAPTGSGKTIICTAFFEAAYRGDVLYPRNDKSIFLWLSDSPELNEQSREKIALKSDFLNLGHCVVIDDAFDEETLEDGKVYFLNTQKLGKNSNLVKPSDSRQYTIWETLANTASSKWDRFTVVIDEAHRGAQGSRTAAQATTIMQKFIKGSPEDKLDPMPVVIGMSATIERFERLAGRVGSTLQKVSVDPADVRASGLLKDRIIITYADKQDGSAENGILQAAVDNWMDKRDRWDRFYQKQHSSRVNPIFVIQVKAGTDDRISDTDLDLFVRTIQDRSGLRFTTGDVVHTFGYTGTINAAGLEIPHASPSQIDGRRKVKVVFFKENLSTGWDCPRAETMMSCRVARDATYIAQLLGRMIRTPLHQRVMGDETLNDVSLYLPYFDRETVDGIVTALKAPECGEIPIDTTGYKKCRIVTVTASMPVPEEIEDGDGHTPSDGTGSSSESDGEAKDTSGSADKTAVKDSDKPEKPSGTEDNGKDSRPGKNRDSDQEVAEKTNNADGRTTNKNSETDGLATPVATAGREFKLVPDEGHTETKEERKERIVRIKSRNKEIAEVIRFINESAFPTYRVGNVQNRDYITSACDLAGLLSSQGIYPKAHDDFYNQVAETIKTFVDELRRKGEYAARESGISEFNLRTVLYHTSNIFTSGKSKATFTSESLLENYSASTEDIDLKFDMAETLLGSRGIGRWYCKQGGKDGDILSLKKDFIIYASDPACVRNLEEKAEDVFTDLKDKHRRVFALPGYSKCRSNFDTIVANVDAVSEHNFQVSEAKDITVSKKCQAWEGHMLVDENGLYYANLNNLETAVLKAEMRQDDFVCWYRNPSTRQGLCVKFEKDGSPAASYPDFIIVRREGDSFVADLLEPHERFLADGLAKAKGLSEYAEKCPQWGRIQVIRGEEDRNGNLVVRRLELTDSKVRERIRSDVTVEQFNKTFQEKGFID